MNPDKVIKTNTIHLMYDVFVKKKKKKIHGFTHNGFLRRSAEVRFRYGFSWRSPVFYLSAFEQSRLAVSGLSPTSNVVK